MNHLKTYPGHLLLYVVGAFDFVSQLPAMGVLTPYAPYITAAGVIAGSLHHAYQTGAAAGVVQTVAQTPAKLVMAALMIGLTLGVGSQLTACASAPTANQQAGIVVSVDIAAGLAIQQHDTDPVKWKARATEYKSIAVELKTVNDAGGATLATLAADLAPLVAKLPPADQLAASALEAALIPYLQSQIPGNANVQNAQTTVDVVLSALISACEAYGA